MLRETVWRVWICWILMSFGPQWGVQSTGAHSCHEVKTAFHLRQIGPLKWVPETAATGWFVAKLRNLPEENTVVYHMRCASVKSLGAFFLQHIGRDIEWLINCE